MGLVTRCVEPGTALAGAHEWAKRLVSLSPDALRCIKRDLNESHARGFEDALEAEARSLAECVTKPAFALAMAAFAKRR
jgi:enoyl-CoA hydratase/carnithine racemase